MNGNYEKKILVLDLTKRNWTDIEDRLNRMETWQVVSVYKDMLLDCLIIFLQREKE